MKTSLFNPDLQIPININGDIQHDFYYGAKLVKNYIFSGKIIIDKLVRYDHRMYLEVIVTEIDNHSYKASMFFTEFIDMMKKDILIFGEASGKFTFMQRGTAIGLKYLGRDD